MAKEDAAEVVTTLSARFTEAELKALRDAAERKQWSLSQLIRAGAYEKAVNILNATGPASYPVKRLLSAVAEQLFNPKLWVKYDNEEPPHEAGAHQDDDFGGARFILTEMKGWSEGVRLSNAMNRLGGELGPMFYEEVMRASAIQGNEELLDPTTSLTSIPEVPIGQPTARREQ